jgi:hypothetical protein
MLEHLAQPEALPDWFAADDLAHYAGEFTRTGFRGGLSWYRSADATWELTRGFDDLRIHQPALFLAGDREPVLAMMPGAADAMRETVPGVPCRRRGQGGDASARWSASSGSRGPS